MLQFFHLNIHIVKMYLLGKKKSSSQNDSGTKKILALLLLFELFTIDFYYETSNNHLKKIIILTVRSECRNWWILHRECDLALDLDKAEWVGGAGC